MPVATYTCQTKAYHLTAPDTQPEPDELPAAPPRDVVKAVNRGALFGFPSYKVCSTC